MLPPILEIYVVWHPKDAAGKDVAEALFNHFQANTFAGLIGGAVEVYVRSVGWRSPDDAPRPIPFPTTAPVQPSRGSPAVLTAVVPVIDTELAHAVQPGRGPWYAYLAASIAAQQADPARVAIFPLVTTRSAAHGTTLGELYMDYHAIGRGHVSVDPRPEDSWCRDLAQGITQHLGNLPTERLTIFISHSSKIDPDGTGGDGGITQRVRDLVQHTRLDKFFSTTDLQPGHNWSAELLRRASTSALLAVRTSSYASRPWCQHEMLAAKIGGAPVVVLDALELYEERGSFLMDHVPRVRVRQDGGGWSDADVLAGLNLLVDECLKRALWTRQGDLSVDSEEIRATWWAPHAPEPATLVAWLHAQLRAASLPVDGPIRIVHPDPPIGPAEHAVLDQIVRLGGLHNELKVVTPRLIAVGEG